MPIAKKAAIAAHHTAPEVSDPAAKASATALGHVVGTIHVETHAMGVVVYGLTAFVRTNDNEGDEEVKAQECKWFCDLLLRRSMKASMERERWAPFLLKNGVPNKVRLLRLREENRRVDLGGHISINIPGFLGRKHIKKGPFQTLLGV
jgi:hypothetical protein